MVGSATDDLAFGCYVMTDPFTQRQSLFFMKSWIPGKFDPDLQPPQTPNLNPPRSHEELLIYSVDLNCGGIGVLNVGVGGS